jgi:hypothetical protein
MHCLVALLAMFFPRIVIVLLVLLSDYMGRAYDTILWPLLGFLFLPYTTLAYAWAVNTNESVTGMFLIVVIIAVLADLGALGGGGSTYRRRRTVVVAR